jgi:hypothetical protein
MDMDGTVGGSASGSAGGSAAPVRRAMVAALVSTACFGIFFLASTQVETIRAQSPWNADPWDAVISFTSQLVAGVAIVTAVRCVPLVLGDAGLVLMRRVLRGVDVVTASIALTVVVDVVAVAAGAGGGIAGAATPWLVALLLVVAATSGVTLLTLVVAWRAIGRRSTTEAAAGPDPVALLARWVLDRLPPPLDRPVVVVGVFALAAGMALSMWHTLIEGVLGNGLAVALAVTLAFAAIEAAGVFVLALAAARYLEIFPPRPARRSA